ncbi:MAG: uncharacterized protein KVP18_002379 [Porospora cf. gigantea A]|nr:MAG: hypothetical protein KVP18_002379 [Porospora cf. gigantea A]
MDLLGVPAEGTAQSACAEGAGQHAMVEDVPGRIYEGVGTLKPNPSIDIKVNEAPEALIDIEVDEAPEGLIDIEVDEAPEGLIDIEVDEAPEGLIDIEVDQAPEVLMDMEVDQTLEGLIETAVEEFSEAMMEIDAAPESQVDMKVEVVHEAPIDVEVDEVSEGQIDVEDEVAEGQIDVESKVPRTSAGVKEVESKVKEVKSKVKEVESKVKEVESKVPITSPVLKEAVTSGLATDVDSSESEESADLPDSGCGNVEGSHYSATSLSGSFHEATHQCNPRRVLRVSRLDYQDPRSSICQSEFRGFANLMPMMVALFLVAKMTANCYLTGFPVDTRLAYLMFKDFFWFMSLWGAIAAYSFLAYFAVARLYDGSMQDSLLSVLKFLMNALLFGATSTTCVLLNMPMMPAAFTLSTGCVHIMKIHSYVSMGQKHFRLKKAGFPSDPCFPSRLTPTNYLRFLVSPALVFEPSFPESEGFRPAYFAHKVLVLLLDLVAMYVLCSTYIIPVADRSYSLTFVETFSQLLPPLACLVFVFFHFAFDTVCNCLAELTLYGDREFYSDWWNATTYDEFSRKWNRPVHDWLLTHIYLEVHQRYGIGKWAATATTFLLSAIMHEIFLAVLCRFVRGYMFSLMLLQIPLIALGRYHQDTTFGNMFFWFGILIGVPLLMVCYTREWSANRHGSMDLYEPFRVF